MLCKSPQIGEPTVASEILSILYSTLLAHAASTASGHVVLSKTMAI